MWNWVRPRAGFKKPEEPKPFRNRDYSIERMQERVEREQSEWEYPF